jgi:ribonuclease P protein component
VTGRPSGGRSPKRRRLSRSAEFERVYRQGRSKSNRFLVLYAFPREEEPAGGDGHGRGEAAAGPRLGLSVSRRVGGAVDRTRVKRVLREAFWAEAERLPEGSDYVVVARPDARELAEREGMAGMRGALAELVDALGAARAGRAAADGSAAPPADGSMPAGSGDPPPAETPAGPSRPGTAG